MLADTQSVVWLTLEPARLSAKATAGLEAARTSGPGISIASTTLWELALLVSRGKITPKLSLSGYLQFIERNFVVLPISAAVAERSMSFSADFPKDPADRIIAATALVHNLPLITSDRAIQESGEVPYIW